MEKVMLPNKLKLFIADVEDLYTKKQEFWYVVDEDYEHALGRFVEEANETWDRYGYYFFEADDDSIREFVEYYENIEIGVYI